MKLPFTAIAVITTTFMSPCAHAEDFNISDWTSADVQPIPGKNSEGSAPELSTDNTHSGKQCLKFVYNFGEGYGYAEYNLNVLAGKPTLTEKAGPLKISFWVRGNPSSKVSGMNIRLIDATHEIFQYPLPDIQAVLVNPDWTLYTTEIDLDKPATHFPSDKNGDLDFPLKLLSFCVDCKSGPDAGSIFIDDLSWE